MTPRTRRVAAGLALAAAAAAAVAVGRRAPALSGEAPAYRRLGPARAPVVIREYSDFECPSCARAHPLFKEILARHGDKVRVSFHHYPLKMHKWAPLAAQAAEAAGFQGRFWDYADRLYEKQGEWSKAVNPRDFLVQYARELGLDEPRFARDLEDPATAEIIGREKARAETIPVTATPTFFINERVVIGDHQLAAQGERFVQRELEK